LYKYWKISPSPLVQGPPPSKAQDTLSRLISRHYEVIIHYCAFIAGFSQASVLSTTNIATVLAGVTAPSTFTISAEAMAAIVKLGTGGVNAATLSAADTAAISACTAAGRANNTASKANLSDGTGSAGAIAL
jgi:hypothetical protein